MFMSIERVKMNESRRADLRDQISRMNKYHNASNEDIYAFILLRKDYYGISDYGLKQIRKIYRIKEQ